MWVLVVVILGASPSVQLHDFDGRSACHHAAVLVQASLKGQGTAYCVERDKSVLGPHDDLAPPSP